MHMISKHVRRCLGSPRVALSRRRRAAAQQPQPGSAATAPEVGADGAGLHAARRTRYGLLKDPVRLVDFRGQTVVLAFFPKARTKG